jgi:homoaconitase
MSAGLPSCAVPTSIHCDHLIQAVEGAERDLKVSYSRTFGQLYLNIDHRQASIVTNKEVFDFLESAARKYGKSTSELAGSL